MSPRIRDAERAKAAIVQAARELLSQNDFSSVSIRDIADAAGVSHGLLQHHFGTREELIAAIITNEIEAFAKATNELPPGTSVNDIERLRQVLRTGFTHFREYILLITRAELAGFEPEKLLDPNAKTPAMMLADIIQRLQERNGARPGAPDARLVSAYVNGIIFSFVSMAPWLLASAGLGADAFDAKLDEVVDMSILVIGWAAGIGPHESLAGPV